MTWRELQVSASGTHHEVAGAPAYAERFDEVLKFHDPGLAPVRRDGLAWHVTPDGRAAYERRFQRTFGFYEGYAAVSATDGWHHIDPSGEDIYPQRYAWCGNFQDERCVVRHQSGHYSHILRDGIPAYTEMWRYAGDYRDGVCVVQDETGRSTHLDASGRLLHGHWYRDLDVFHKGYARAQDDDGWMHVDFQGRPVYPRRFAGVEPFYNGQARVQRFDGGLEVIDETGHTLVELRAAIRSPFAELSADMVGYWRTQAIAAAAETGVVEAMPGTVEDIAQRCGLIPERAKRFLRALGELQIVEQIDGVWTWTTRGQYLRASHPLTLKDAAREYSHDLSRLWERLPEALRLNGRWHAPAIFERVAEDTPRCAAHHRMLASYARHDYLSVPAALQLRGDEHVIDAGGGVGVLSGLLLEAYPDLRISLLDLPSVIELAGGELGPSDPIDYLAGNIFDHWNVQADAVVLARVLHDWDDDDARRILRRAREALPRGGRIFIVEMILVDDGQAGGLCDLHLLMVTGGKERSEGAYAALMKETGFSFRETRRLNALPSVIVGIAE